jgi:hypothetical protein
MRPARILRQILWPLAMFIVFAGLGTSCGIRQRIIPPVFFANIIECGSFESVDPARLVVLWQLDPKELFGWDVPSASLGRRSLFIDAAKIPSKYFATVSQTLSARTSR